MSVKIGIIGFGLRGITYVKDFSLSLAEQIEFIAVVEPSEESYKRSCSISGIHPRRYLNPKEMLEHEKLDAIIVATPNNFHLSSVRDIVGANLPILLEKPLEGTMSACFELARLLSSYESPVVVAHCMRYAPILQHALNMVKENVLGKINSMRFVQNCHYGDTMFRDWRRCRKNTTSFFLEKATHDFDIMNMFVGSYPKFLFALSGRYEFGGDRPNDLRCPDCPEQVTCRDSILNKQVQFGEVLSEEESSWKNLCVYAKEIDVGDDEMCMMKYDNGIIAYYVQTFYTPKNYTMRFYTLVGSKGVLDIDLNEYHGQLRFHPRYGANTDVWKLDFDYLNRNHYDGDTYLVRHFLDCVQGRAKAMTTLKDAFASELIGLAATKSADEKKLVEIAQIVPEDLKSYYLPVT